MSDAQIDRLLRLYPARWRDRYGEELAGVIAESTDGDVVPWRTRVDVVVGAGRERLRAVGLSRNGAPRERVVGGIVLALCAWWLFVLGAVSVLKFSEHWRDAMPVPSRTGPTAAYDIALGAVAAASLVVLAGVGIAVRHFVTFLRSGGWRSIRTPVVSATGLTFLAAAGVTGLTIWAHRLSAAQRNGHDGGYAVGFLVVAAICATALLAWTIAGVATARRLPLSESALRALAWLLSGLALAMAAAITSTGLWWATRATSWPPSVATTPDRSTPSPNAPLLLAAGAAMLLATLIAVFAAGHALRAVRSDGDHGAVR